jgi:hypothetical protein
MKENVMPTIDNNTNNKVRLTCYKLLVLLAWVLFYLGTVHAADPPSYEINGFYLGSTAEDLGATIEDDGFPNKKEFEAKSKGVQLFFIRTKKNEYRLYRIISEKKVEPDKINSILKKLIRKYGTPDRQQVKTVSTRPKNKAKFSTTSKNKAIWKINESQEYIVEIEPKRVVFELIDHAPENLKGPQGSGDEDSDGFTVDDNWNSDY